jgi:hypothetical protein
MEWTDKEICVDIFALHKSEIERTHNFELLKPLNIMHVLCIVLLSCFWIWEE